MIAWATAILLVPPVFMAGRWATRTATTWAVRKMAGH